jgi:hypothetical protein
MIRTFVCVDLTFDSHVMEKQKTGDIGPTVFPNASEGKGSIPEKKSDGTRVIFLLNSDEDGLWKAKYTCNEWQYLSNIY